METKTSITDMTPGQKRQIKQFIKNAIDPSFIETVLKQINSGKSGAQNIITHGDELVQKLRESLVTTLKDLSVLNLNQYANEEVSSSYGYLSGYTKSKGLTEQTNRLRELFPGLGYANQDLLKKIKNSEIPLPKDAEGWFAIPNWFKNRKIFGSKYSKAVQKILDVLKQTRNGNFYNYREGQIDEKHLRQTLRTKKFFSKLAKEQGNPDILIVAAQFGILHRGRSVRRARVVFLSGAGNQVGLGAFAIGVMLLTHPERLQHYNDLWIDCAGDEFKPAGGDSFSEAPNFDFHGGELKFDASGVSSVSGSCGSVSAFGSQQ